MFFSIETSPPHLTTLGFWWFVFEEIPWKKPNIWSHQKMEVWKMICQGSKVSYIEKLRDCGLLHKELRKIQPLTSRARKEIHFFFMTSESRLTPLKFNSSPLKNGGWKTTFLVGRSLFRGELLNFGGVNQLGYHYRPLHLKKWLMAKVDGFSLF